MNSLLPSRRRDLHPHIKDDIVAETTSPEASLDGQQKPEHISLPPSRPQSIGAGSSSIAEMEPAGTNLQDAPGHDQNKEVSIQEQADGDREAGDDEDIVNDNSLN